MILFVLDDPSRRCGTSMDNAEPTVRRESKRKTVERLVLRLEALVPPRERHDEPIAVDM
jgi:hypothetical protein